MYYLSKKTYILRPKLVRQFWRAAEMRKAAVLLSIYSRRSYRERRWPCRPTSGLEGESEDGIITIAGRLRSDQHGSVAWELQSNLFIYLFRFYGDGTSTNHNNPLLTSSTSSRIVHGRIYLRNQHTEKNLPELRLKNTRSTLD
ncbi:unnamed protein product [Nesidiocoris tenuis]|uniref:Uncharacterized protein n=1 Tax=Nesidiocoris tenuis TaxID=355587 RepID=A0A6H5GWY2_9HEMI|nr:unnamed protein product [Nesidiocoris tenuis]